MRHRHGQQEAPAAPAAAAASRTTSRAKGKEKVGEEGGEASGSGTKEEVEVRDGGGFAAFAIRWLSFFQVFFNKLIKKINWKRRGNEQKYIGFKNLNTKFMATTMF